MDGFPSASWTDSSSTHSQDRCGERSLPIYGQLLTRFDLTWDGQAMNLPERFWNDLPGLDLETSTLDPKTLAPDLQWKAKEFLEGLRQPRVSLSAEGGTVLIEWERPEECDSRSTIRWIVSKSGTVLRHRHCPPHECRDHHSYCESEYSDPVPMKFRYFGGIARSTGLFEYPDSPIFTAKTTKC